MSATRFQRKRRGTTTRRTESLPYLPSQTLATSKLQNNIGKNKDIPPDSKEALFALQMRLLCIENKACLEDKQALF